MHNSIAILLVSLSSMLAGALAGAFLRKRLPEDHLNPDSASLVRAGIGLISTMTALVLGLLISSAKVSYDTTATELQEMTADIVMADQLLSQYGPTANNSRVALRGAVTQLVQRMWGGAGHPSSRSHPFIPTEGWQQFSSELNNLPNQTEAERLLRKGINEAIDRVTQARLHIFSETGKNLPAPFLVILILWLTIIFTSFTLYAPLNSTVVVFIFLFALSSAGALYLIGELNSPFSGMLQQSKGPLERALVPQ